MTRDAPKNEEYTVETAKRQKYDRRLDEYEYAHGYKPGGLVKEATELALKLKKEGKLENNEFKVLDLGGGLGVALYQIKHDLEEALKEHGVKVTTYNLNYLDYTGKLSGREKEQAPRQVLGDAQALPFHDNSIHFITSTMVSQYVPDKLRMFEEAYRVMHPEGKARITYLTHELKGVTKQDLEEQGFQVRIPMEEPLPKYIMESKAMFKDQFRSLHLNGKSETKLHFPFHFEGHEVDPKVPNKPRNKAFRVSKYTRE
ncbi:MAG: class I SAM-dependent methyltransferase [Candidatus Diapherotrites archaeon]|nr:class I SAM-dependent methyltransferase [Candidatus Diapherotrites archaeon]